MKVSLADGNLIPYALADDTSVNRGDVISQYAGTNRWGHARLGDTAVRVAANSVNNDGRPGHQYGNYHLWTLVHVPESAVVGWDPTNHQINADIYLTSSAPADNAMVDGYSIAPAGAGLQLTPKLGKVIGHFICCA